MTESFMTTKGDRSGVDTPSPRAKARHLLVVAALTLQGVQDHWREAEPSEEIERHVLRVIGTLEKAVAQLRKPE